MLTSRDHEMWSISECGQSQQYLWSVIYMFICFNMLTSSSGSTSFECVAFTSENLVFTFVWDIVCTSYLCPILIVCPPRGQIIDAYLICCLKNMKKIFLLKTLGNNLHKCQWNYVLSKYVNVYLPKKIGENFKEMVVYNLKSFLTNHLFFFHKHNPRLQPSLCF